jgi:hypothetical protein
MAGNRHAAVVFPDVVGPSRVPVVRDAGMARRLQEVVMKTVTPEYRSDYNRAIFAEGEAVGEAIGEAKAIITVLESRGLTLSADARARITSCGDLDQLDA